MDQLYEKNPLYQKVLAARAAAGPGNAYDLEWTDPSTGRTKMSHPLNLPFTSLTVVPTSWCARRPRGRRPGLKSSWRPNFI